MSTRVTVCNRIIPTISIPIIPLRVKPSTIYLSIRRYKPAYIRVVVSSTVIVQPCLAIYLLPREGIVVAGAGLCIASLYIKQASRHGKHGVISFTLFRGRIADIRPPASCRLNGNHPWLPLYRSSLHKVNDITPFSRKYPWRVCRVNYFCTYPTPDFYTSLPSSYN